MSNQVTLKANGNSVTGQRVVVESKRTGKEGSSSSAKICAVLDMGQGPYDVYHVRRYNFMAIISNGCRTVTKVKPGLLEFTCHVQDGQISYQADILSGDAIPEFEKQWFDSPGAAVAAAIPGFRNNALVLAGIFYPNFQRLLYIDRAEHILSSIDASTFAYCDASGLRCWANTLVLMADARPDVQAQVFAKLDLISNHPAAPEPLCSLVRAGDLSQLENWIKSPSVKNSIGRGTSRRRRSSPADSDEEDSVEVEEAIDDDDEAVRTPVRLTKRQRTMSELRQGRARNSISSAAHTPRRRLKQDGPSQTSEEFVMPEPVRVSQEHHVVEDLERPTSTALQVLANYISEDLLHTIVERHKHDVSVGTRFLLETLMELAQSKSAFWEPSMPLTKSKDGLDELYYVMAEIQVPFLREMLADLYLSAFFPGVDEVLNRIKEEIARRELGGQRVEVSAHIEHDDVDADILGISVFEFVD